MGSSASDQRINRSSLSTQNSELTHRLATAAGAVRLIDGEVDAVPDDADRAIAEEEVASRGVVATKRLDAALGERAGVRLLVHGNERGAQRVRGITPHPTRV